MSTEQEWCVCFVRERGEGEIHPELVGGHTTAQSG